MGKLEETSWRSHGSWSRWKGWRLAWLVAPILLASHGWTPHEYDLNFEGKEKCVVVEQKGYQTDPQMAGCYQQHYPCPSSMSPTAARRKNSRFGGNRTPGNWSLLQLNIHGDSGIQWLQVTWTTQHSIPHTKSNIYAICIYIYQDALDPENPGCPPRNCTIPGWSPGLR